MLNLLCTLLIIGLGLWFAALNATLVTINLYFYSFEAPLALLLVGALLLGFILASLSSALRLFKLKRKLSKMEKNLPYA